MSDSNSLAIPSKLTSPNTAHLVSRLLPLDSSFPSVVKPVCVQPLPSYDSRRAISFTWKDSSRGPVIGAAHPSGQRLVDGEYGQKVRRSGQQEPSRTTNPQPAWYRRSHPIKESRSCRRDDEDSATEDKLDPEGESQDEESVSTDCDEVNANDGSDDMKLATT